MKAFPIFIEDSPWLEILESDISSPGKMPLKWKQPKYMPGSKPRDGRISGQLKGTRREVKV